MSQPELTNPTNWRLRQRLAYVNDVLDGYGVFNNAYELIIREEIV